MPVKFNYKKAIKTFENYGGTTKFPDSLKKVLIYAQNDKNLTDVKHLAYLLATAKAESDYSLQRWEADYVCGDAGVPYRHQPCQKAINYYRSSDGKKNYFDLGTDKNGMAYFGRGLIQLTGKGNYEKYGKLIGVNLINDGDKALVPKNSYKIASTFLNRKRGSAKKSVFDYVNEGDLHTARYRVNGGTKGKDRVNKEYYLWLKVLEKVKAKAVKTTRKKRKVILYGSLTLIILGIGTYFLLRKKK